MGGKLGPPLWRFEQKFIPEPMSGCWLWLGGATKLGYGFFYFPPRNMVSAHIASWELYKGSRNGLYVLHTCDNPSCVNPDHLYLGTQQDNMRDRDSRGRQYDRNGSRNGRAQVTEDQVRAIRADTRMPRFIARDYPGIPYSTIQKIRYRTTWKCVP